MANPSRPGEPAPAPRFHPAVPPLLALLVLLALLAPGCRSVDYLPLRSGTFLSDPLDGGQGLSGVELVLDLEANVATLRDGDSSIDLRLERVADREHWVGDCGTMSSYAMLEQARIEPTEFEIRGRTVSYDHLRARCYAEGVWLDSLDGGGSVRWIFGPRD